MPGEPLSWSGEGRWFLPGYSWAQPTRTGISPGIISRPASWRLESDGGTAMSGPLFSSPDRRRRVKRIDMTPSQSMRPQSAAGVEGTTEPLAPAVRVALSAPAPPTQERSCSASTLSSTALPPLRCRCISSGLRLSFDRPPAPKCVSSELFAGRASSTPEELRPVVTTAVRVALESAGAESDECRCSCAAPFPTAAAWVQRCRCGRDYPRAARTHGR